MASSVVDLTLSSDEEGEVVGPAKAPNASSAVRDSTLVLGELERLPLPEALGEGCTQAPLETATLAGSGSARRSAEPARTRAQRRAAVCTLRGRRARHDASGKYPPEPCRERHLRTTCCSRTRRHRRPPPAPAQADMYYADLDGVEGMGDWRRAAEREEKEARRRTMLARPMTSAVKPERRGAGVKPEPAGRAAEDGTPARAGAGDTTKRPSVNLDSDDDLCVVETMSGGVAGADASASGGAGSASAPVLDGDEDVSVTSTAGAFALADFPHVRHGRCSF